MKSRKRARKKSLLKKYFTIVFSIVAVFLGISGIIAMGYNFTAGEETVNTVQQKNNQEETNTIPPKQETPNILETEQPTEKKEEKKQEQRINIAVFGVDNDGLRADVDFVVSFHIDTKEIHLVSVPRDTRVTMPKEMIREMEKRGRQHFIPTRNGVRGQCKLTEIHAYAGDGYRNQYSVMMLEDLLGIKIDYFVKVNISGFRKIVDAIGGIDMEVEDRLYYSDPEQGLYIDLRPGYQHLNGKQAEGLVRFREGYAQKDLKRIQVQQDFMKEFMKKILNTDTLLGNLPELVKIAFDYVETDISIGDALKYVKYIKDIKMENVTMETIPGEGGSYFDIDKEGTKELVDRVFYGIEPEKPEKEESNENNSNEEEKNNTINFNSKDLKIEVSNGGIINGMAGKKRDMLKEKGYDVAFISTYSGEQQKTTRIVVEKEGIGEDLIPYFENAVVEINPQLISNGTDIKIIIGLDEK